MTATLTAQELDALYANETPARTGPCHFGMSGDNLIGGRCDTIGDNDTFATDLTMVTCGECKYIASKVLRYAMRNPDRLPKYARAKDEYGSVAF